MTQKILLGDVATIQTGPFGSQLHQKDYVKDGTPIITVEHLGQDRFGKNGLPRVTDLDKQRLNRYWLKEGDTVFSRVGSVDRASYVHKEEDGWLFSSRCLRVSPDKEKVNPRFLSFLLRSNHFTSYIKSIAVGATMPSINTKLLATAPIMIPSKDKQDFAAEVLGKIESKIELNRRMNETLEQMGQALFKHYFIHNPETKTWPKKSLDEIADFLNGAAMQKFPPNGNATLPVIKIREMSAGITSNTDLATIKIPNKYLVSDGDMLFSWSGTLIVKIWTEGQGALNQHLFKVTSSKYPQWFYYLWTKHHLQQFIDTAAGKATTMGHIQRHHLTDAKVNVPDNKKLDELDKIFSPLHQQQITNSIENRELAKLRDLLLPRLISGRVKLD